MEPPQDGPPEQIGPYRLEEPIGRGGMGTVWRAWDERLKRRVAVKQIRAETNVSHVRERLRREAQAAARLNHPAIVHIYDIVEGAGGDWIVMELVGGQTLRQLLDERGPLHPTAAARLGCEIAEGLAEAHELSILHRDLKAVNVMVTPAGHAKILDFGLAKELPLAGSEQDITLSAPGVVLGTAYAMSPEQALGRELDERSDLFSLGSLLYETVTGTPPFRGDSPTASLARVLSFQPRPLRDVVTGLPAQFSDLVQRLLEKDAAYRPRNAREVAAVLAPLAVGDAGIPVPAGSVAPSSLAYESTLLTRAEGISRPAAMPSQSEQRRLLGERRVMNVVCCGLVELNEDSGEAGFLDPEVLAESMAGFQALAREVCERQSGHLGAALGHLLWLYFGYPQAHENDLQLAIRAARELVARMGEIRSHLDARGKRRLGLRIAVHTGPAAVVSRPGQEEQLQLGSVLDLATSLQNLAPAGQVVISGASLPLAARDFSTEALPPVRVPGAAEPVALYRVLGEIDPRERESGVQAPLIGREREIDLLRDRFQLAREGTGQMILIAGEAGIGKSRLVTALRERLAAEDPVWWITYGSPSTQNSPLGPIIDLLDHLVSESGEISPGRKLDRLKDLVGESPVPESVPLLASLLSLPTEEPRPPLALAPEAQRTRTFEALLALITETAERRPLVFVIEDLHWVDASTIELLGLLCEEITDLPLLLLGTCRPEFKAPWDAGSHVSHLVLNRLADSEAVALIDHLASGAGIPVRLRQQILARTEGVPLFVEELTKAVVEAGWTGGPLEIPSTLGGSLAARFNRLGTAKEVAQIASVIGRTFSLDLLKAIAPLDAAALQRGLDQLMQVELVHRRGVEPRARYTFKHALIQDTAYASLLAQDRRDLHLRIAQALEDLVESSDRTRLSQWIPPEGGKNWRNLLAHHWSQATDPRHPDPDVIRKALSHLTAAGEQALGLNAYQEASAHLESALEILSSLPEGEERDRQELSLQARKGAVLYAIRGWGAPEVGEAYRRARELCRKLEERKELSPILFGLWAHHLIHNDYEESLRLAEEYLDEARRTENADLAMAHCALGNILLGTCRLPESLYHLEMSRALSSIRSQEDDYVQQLYSPWVAATGLLTWTFLHLGLEGKATACKDAALRKAQEIGHPFTTAIALSGSILYHRMLGDAAAALTVSEQVLELSKAMGGLPDFDLAAGFGAAWAKAMLGRADEVIDPILDLIASFSKKVGQASFATFCVLGGEICQCAGRIEEALALTARGLEAAENGQLFPQVELLSLRGRLLLDLARQERMALDAAEREAEAALAQAFDLASRRLQLFLAERIHPDLCRLLEAAGRPAEAEAVLNRLQRLRHEVSLTVERVLQKVEEDADRPSLTSDPQRI